MEFGQKKFREIDLFHFMGFFFTWTFLNFLAYCTPLYIVDIYYLLLLCIDFLHLYFIDPTRNFSSLGKQFCPRNRWFKVCIFDQPRFDRSYSHRSREAISIINKSKLVKFVSRTFLISIINKSKFVK